MKQIKIYKILFAVIISLIVITSCKKKIDYGEIEIYIDKALFDNIPEFSYNGQSLNYNNSGDIYFYTANVDEDQAEIDYTFEFKGQHFTSKGGAATGSPVLLTAPENGEIITKTLSYELRPTGNSDEPFHIFDLNSDDNDEGLTGNWVRSDGASYLKFSGSSIYLCNGGSLQEFSGTYNASENTATLVEGTTTLTFEITPEGDDKILIAQYVSNEHIGSTYYFSTNDYFI